MADNYETKLKLPIEQLKYANIFIGKARVVGITTLTIEIEQETDGRWLAEIASLPGVLAYGQTPNEAMAKAQALALRVIADRLEQGEESADLKSISFAAA